MTEQTHSTPADGGKQSTSHILMIRPTHFAFNEETAASNAFQLRSREVNVHRKGLSEFDDFVLLLRKNDVNVEVVEDTPQPHTPDSLFPNNWISFHEDGTLCLYPMYARSRRAERKEHVLEKIKEQFQIARRLDLTYYEKNNLFLEGTGSMVLDRKNKIAYACLSPRTELKVLTEFCEKMDYEPVTFTAVDKNGLRIYHTNVMMCIGDQYAVVCLDSIPDAREKANLAHTIAKTRKDIIEINYDQLHSFAGNMLQVEDRQGQKLLVMSSQAFRSLAPEQVQKLNSYNRIVHASLETIETNGGGSARCMMAEIYLPYLNKNI